jgi:hypothetical protein
MVCFDSALIWTVIPHNTSVTRSAGAFDLNDVAVCLEVMAANGCLGIIRVPFDSDNRKAFARRCLDAGAVGMLMQTSMRTCQQAHRGYCVLPVVLHYLGLA